MATKDDVVLKQVDMDALDEMDEAARQAIGFMELVLRDILDRYETDGTEYEQVTASGISNLQHATRERLEKALAGLWESEPEQPHLTRKAPPKAKRAKR